MTYGTGKSMSVSQLTRASFSADEGKKTQKVNYSCRGYLMDIYGSGIQDMRTDKFSYASDKKEKWSIEADRKSSKVEIYIRLLFSRGTASF